MPLVFARGKKCLANYTEATFFLDNGKRHTEVTSPLTRTLNTTILKLFMRVQKRAIYTWMAHVECIETLDWQLVVDKKHVFLSRDFLPGQVLAHKKMKHYPEVFSHQSVLEFKPLVLVDLDIATQKSKHLNYEHYMRDLMQDQPFQLQSWNAKIQRLRQVREGQLALMRVRVQEEDRNRGLRMYGPGVIEYITAIETISGFDTEGDIVCHSSQREYYVWNSIAQLFVQCSVLAKKHGLNKYTRHADWQIKINGQHSFDEIDYRDCEAGCLPPVMADHPTIFTPQFTIEMRPVFLVYHRDEMRQLRCSNLLRFTELMHEKWVAHEKKKMEQFVFAEFGIFPQDTAKISLDPGVNKLIFDELVKRNNRPAAASYYRLH